MPNRVATVTTTATLVLPAEQVGQRRVQALIHNSSTGTTIYLGDRVTVDATNGYPLEGGQMFPVVQFSEHRHGIYTGPVYAVTGAGAAEVRTWELVQR